MSLLRIEQPASDKLMRLNYQHQAMCTAWWGVWQLRQMRWEKAAQESPLAMVAQATRKDKQHFSCSLDGLRSGPIEAGAPALFLTWDRELQFANYFLICHLSGSLRQPC